jgi:imidazolonepropionase-like amidohydrolase
MILHFRGRLLPQDVEQDIFVRDGVFTFGPVEDAQTVFTGGVLIPGLVDVHVHLGMASPAGEDALPEEQIRASAAAHLARGVLALREPGSIFRGAAAGFGPKEQLPRIYTAGQYLVAPGRFLPGFGREVSDDELADAAMEEFLAGGGSWVKVIGDWPGPDGRLVKSFTTEALTRVAERVHKAGGRVAVHALDEETITASIDAGVDSIEHATLLREEHIANIVAAGIAVVPTLSATREFPGVLPQDEADRHRLISGMDQQHAAVRLAAEADVVVLAGTDAGLVPHGLIHEEIMLLRDYGLEAEQALGAGSWEARRFLGLPGIEEGAPADLVCYDHDPREDLSILASPSVVVLDGQLIER